MPGPTAGFPLAEPEAPSITTDRSADGWTVVSVAGEIDVANSEQLEQALLDVVSDNRSRAIAVDLGGISLIDSTGLTALVVAHQHARLSGGLRLVGVSGPARKVLELTGLDRILPIHATMTELEACTACNAATPV